MKDKGPREIEKRVKGRERERERGGEIKRRKKYEMAICRV